MMDPKSFLKASSAPIYATTFEGGARRKKNVIFWSQFSKTCLKTTFFGLFFQSFACGAENLAKMEK